jgi:superfamily II DNA or RNA helicase
MPSLPSSKAQQALIDKVLPKIKKYSPRNGQIALLRALAANPKIKTVKCIFPTGYGKTDAIELSYKLLKQQGRVNALFIIVPSKEQLSSYLADIEHDFKTKWGDEITAYRFSSDFIKIVTRDILQNKCEVIVATCQTLMTPGNLEVAKRLLAESGRRWMIALDELHRYSEYKQFGKTVGVLLQQSPEVVLGLTAAKDRTDGQPVAVSNPEIVIEVSHADALEEKAIRPFRTSIHDYTVTIEFQGEIYDVKTSELAKLEGDYIAAKEAQGVSGNKALAQVREEIAYKDKYISPLVQNAVDCLYDKRNKVGQDGLIQAREHRMLVFARDQKHAEHLKNYFVKYADLSADWIGDKRPDEINEQILRDFIAGNLDVMINVNKASEGFNCVQASVMLFLNNVRGNTVTILQQLGRGLRRNYAIPVEKDVCHVFLSEDHPAKEYFEGIEDLQPKDFNPEAIGTGGDRKTPIYDIPDIQFVDAELHAVRIVDRTMEGGNKDEMFDSVKAVLSNQHGEKVAKQLSMEMLIEALRQAHLPIAEKEVKATMGSTDRIEQAKKQNANAVRTLSTNIVRALSLGNFNKSRQGDVNKAVNTLLKKRFNAGTDSMNESELNVRHSFIQEINRKLKELPREKFAQEFPTLCIS